MKLRPSSLVFSLVAAFTASAIPSPAQQPTPLADNKPLPLPSVCPLHDSLMKMDGHTKGDEHAKMDERGEKGMGFSQSSNTHHFLPQPDGGIIRVEANDLKDAAARAEIRMHLTHIALAFAAGDFNIPMFVHDTVPPGVPDMKRLAAKITYTFEQTPNGGQVRIRTADFAALNAIHEFLHFQAVEHQTKDPINAR